LKDLGMFNPWSETIKLVASESLFFLEDIQNFSIGTIANAVNILKTGSDQNTAYK
jgi:hypothetical protein